MSLENLKSIWIDSPQQHKFIHEDFISKVNETDYLKAHRDFVEQNAFGFGERSFHWMWKLIIDKMPERFSFCEVGVFRGQVLSLIKLLSDKLGRGVQRFGITPLDSTDGHWQSDYKKDIELMHDTFYIPKDYTILHGLSTDADIIKQAAGYAPYDIVFIDGGHTKDVVDSDLKHYTNIVKPGGYLVVDDAASRMNMPFGYFTGIKDVCDALAEWEQTELAKGFKFQFNVVHNMVYKREK